PCHLPLLLHAFPTRRSSDLEGRLVGFNTDRSGFFSALARELPTADLTDVVLFGAGGAGSAVADALVGAGTARLSVQHYISQIRGDRKSTRLNSSHVSISYAV